MTSRREACIVGVGETDFSRNSGRSGPHLSGQAIVAALADAGLTPAAIDGVLPGGPHVSAEEIMSMFALSDVRFTASLSIGGATPVACLGLAKLAIEGGVAETVVIYVGRNGRSGPPVAERATGMPNQSFRNQLERPFGWATPAQHYATICRRHMHMYGTTKEHMGIVSVTMRAHAQLNPKAMMAGRPMTLDDYYASEMIAEPYQKFDCCLETDGGAAVIVTTRERAEALRSDPITISAVAEGHPDTPDDLVGRPNPLEIGLTKAAPRAFAQAGISPRDVSAAMIYDCFTFEVIHQLEEAGFCERGGGGDFVKSGAIGRDGVLPVNTHGGLMSEAHIIGLNHVVEAVRQLRRECGERQLADPNWVAVTGWGDFGDGSIALLRNGA